MTPKPTATISDVKIDRRAARSCQRRYSSLAIRVVRFSNGTAATFCQRCAERVVELVNVPRH